MTTIKSSLTRTNTEEIDKVTMPLNQNFYIKNLGDLIFFLGFDVAHNDIGSCHKKLACLIVFHPQTYC